MIEPTIVVAVVLTTGLVLGLKMRAERAPIASGGRAV